MMHAELWLTAWPYLAVAFLVGMAVGAAIPMLITSRTGGEE
jgi:hypothetical protein